MSTPDFRRGKRIGYKRGTFAANCVVRQFIKAYPSDVFPGITPEGRVACFVRNLLQELEKRIRELKP